MDKNKYEKIVKEIVELKLQHPRRIDAYTQAYRELVDKKY